MSASVPEQHRPDPRGERETSPYVELDRAAWAALADDMESPLTREEIRALRGLGDELDLIQNLLAPLGIELTDKAIVEKAMELHKSTGGKIATAAAGDVLRLGALTITVLWPPRALAHAPPAGDPNDRALVAHVRSGSFDLLLTADAESNVTGGLPLPRVEALKVAHHGSADRDPDLVAGVRPEVAVISVGEGNDYGHPAPPLLADLRSVGAEARADGVDISTIYMTLVRTRMSAPTDAFRYVPGMRPERAADLVCHAIVDRPATVAPWWLPAAEVATDVARAPLDAVMGLYYRMTEDTPSARGEGGSPVQSREGSPISMPWSRRSSPARRAIRRWPSSEGWSRSAHQFSRSYVAGWQT